MDDDLLLDDESLLLDEEVPEDLESKSNENIKKMASELEIVLTDDEKRKLTEKKPRKGRAKKDVPTSEELDSMSDEEVESNSGIDEEIEDLYQEFGSFLLDKVKIKEDSGIKQVIPTGIRVLDTVLGGGFAIGAMEMIAGYAGSGKSMLAIQSLGNAQKKYKGRILASFLDSEEATTTIRLSNLGVKYPKIKPYNDITIEKVFRFIEGNCVYKETKDLIDIPSMIIWDSVANTLSQKEREAEDINSTIGFKARALSVFIPKYVAKLSMYNICLLTVNQLRDSIQIGPFSQPKELNFMKQGKTIPGGNSLKFNAFQLLSMRVKSTVDSDKFGFDGIVSEVICVKNKLFPPNIAVNIVGNFVTGFSDFWTSFLFLSECKRVVNAGGWFYLQILPTKKFRARDSETLYKTDPNFKEAFDSTLEEALKTELIDKYDVII